MSDASPLRDVTGTVPLDDPAAVAEAVDAILARSYGPASFDRALLRSSFEFVDRLYAGRQRGWLACDMPYHDLRHALDAALATARLVDGCRIDACDGALAPDLGLVAVLLALLHDTGFLRNDAESALRGPQLGHRHEARSATFAADYLRSTSLAAHASLAPLIMTTRMASSPAQVLEGRDGPAVTIGRMLGSADLLCQMADPRYPERCYYHLYPELLLGGDEAGRTPGTPPGFVAEEAHLFLARTPAFHEQVVAPRLAGDLANVARHLCAHFGGPDPYAEGVRSNVRRCAAIVSGNRWELLDGPPPTTTRDLDPIYLGAALPGRPAH